MAKKKKEVIKEPVIIEPIANPVGRPSSFTKDLADKICAQLAMGESLRTVLKGDDMPAMQTIFNWMRTNKEFLEQYARAKEESADALADEILDIADDGSNDWMEIHKGGYSSTIVDQEAVQRSKLRVETRKWVASKLKPKKYGDKVDVTSDGKIIEGNTIVFKNFSGTKPTSK